MIVGYFDFRSVPYYAIASSFVIFISGLQNALFSALMPVAAVMGAKNDAVGLGSLLERSTRYGMFVLFASGLPMFMFAHPLLVLWVGTDYAAQSTPILQILVVANIVRLSATPYATLLIGTGQQRLTLLSPIVEGIVNVIVSVWAGSMYGSIGVAIGTLVGALVAVSINILYNLPRTKDIALTRPEYVKHGLLRPLACALPFFLMLLPISSLIARIILGVVVLLICVGLSWQLGLRESERKRILLIVNKRLQVRVV